jgi:methyltransferase (TIGR00027 family)
MDAVANTALVVAAVRAGESMRADRLFDDPLASAFVTASDGVGALPDVNSSDPRVRALLRGIVVRTRYFDEVLADAAVTCRQVVILGAGLDTRAFRLAWPDGPRVFELDGPELLAWKQDVLDDAKARPACERIVVPVDLHADWTTPLAAAGHQTDEPTAWLAEGLLAYLDQQLVERLLTEVGRRSADGSRLGLTIRAPSARPPLSDLWVSHAPPDAVAWLGGHGWRATQAVVGERAAAYGRTAWSGLTSRSLVDGVRLRASMS